MTVKEYPSPKPQSTYVPLAEVNPDAMMEKGEEG
jgi:hypothetical protein